MGPSPLSGQYFAVPGIRRTPSAGEGSHPLIRPALRGAWGWGARRRVSSDPGPLGGLLPWAGLHPPEAGMVAVWTAWGWSRGDSGP